MSGPYTDPILPLEEVYHFKYRPLCSITIVSVREGHDTNKDDLFLGANTVGTTADDIAGVTLGQIRTSC
jgi:hypothetical protein